MATNDRYCAIALRSPASDVEVPGAFPELDRGDALALGAKLFEVRGLVLLALPFDEIGLCVLVGGPLELLPRHRELELELRQVLALEKRMQVRT